MADQAPAAPLTVTAAGSAIKLPAVKLQPLTDAANQAALAQVREGYSNKVAIGANTAGGGTGYVKGSIAKDRLAAAGYLSVNRQQGWAAGGELSWDLRPKP